MKNVIGSLLAVAGLAAAANAQSKLDVQVSLDGVNWADSVEVTANSAETRTVLVRYTMTWLGTAATPVGFASLTFQPTVGGARAVDSFQAFANQGNNGTGGGVDLDGSPLDGPFGRLKPFAGTGPSGAQSYITHRHTGGAGGAPNDLPAGESYLRIARNDVTRWCGTGPTSGTSAANNFNGAGGVACVQKGSGNVSATDPPFQGGITNVEVMRLALTVGGVGNGEMHDLTLGAPVEGMSRNSTTGAREASWFSSGSDNSGSIKGAVTTDGATIHITPAPGALALLGLGGLVAGRRRR